MRPLARWRAPIVSSAVAGCMLASAAAARPPLLGLDEADRDRCVAAHPRTEPQIPVDPTKLVEACLAQLPIPDVLPPSPLESMFPRPVPTEAEVGALCDPAAWISFEAALCIAEGANLPEGIEPPTAELRVDAELNTVVWHVDVVQAREERGWSGKALRIDAIDGTVRKALRYEFVSGGDGRLPSGSRRGIAAAGS